MRLFGFNVIIFHASQFKTFSSSIQLKHTDNDFYFEHRKYIRQNEKKKKKGSTNRCEDKTIQTPT